MTTTIVPAKPRLRGVLHAGIAPAVVAAGIVLVVLSPTAGSRIATAVYALTSVILFATSGIYHRATLSWRVDEVLRRIDHSNIYLIIAGTYTPFAVLALTGTAQLVILLVIWIGAAAGIVFRTVWLGAPRWLYTSLYIALGWVAVFFLPQFLDSVGAVGVVLVAAGGLMYSAGGIIYGLKRPDPWPAWYGFHEVFHTLTVIAWICQYTAVLLLVLAARDGVAG